MLFNILSMDYYFLWVDLLLFWKLINFYFYSMLNKCCYLSYNSPGLINIYMTWMTRRLISSRKRMYFEHLHDSCLSFLKVFLLKAWKWHAAQRPHWRRVWCHLATLLQASAELGNSAVQWASAYWATAVCLSLSAGHLVGLSEESRQKYLPSKSQYSNRGIGRERK